MRSTLIAMIIFSANFAFADTATFKIEGMTCQSCVKHVKKDVCDKMQDLEKCEVSVGSVKMVSKAGTSIDTKKVEELVLSTGSYKVISSDVKSSGAPK